MDDDVLQLWHRHKHRPGRLHCGKDLHGRGLGHLVSVAVALLHAVLLGPGSAFSTYAGSDHVRLPGRTLRRERLGAVRTGWNDTTCGDDRSCLEGIELDDRSRNWRRHHREHGNHRNDGFVRHLRRCGRAQRRGYHRSHSRPVNDHSLVHDPAPRAPRRGRI